MVKQRGHKVLSLSVVDSFSHVAVWQGAGFVILLLLVWFNELTDVPALLAGRPASPPDLARGCISSAGVLFAAIITIGQTYLQQRSIVSGMLTICCYSLVRLKFAKRWSMESITLWY